MSDKIDINNLTIEEIQKMKLSKEELLSNEQFKELAKKYNLKLEKHKKPSKTLDELYEICYEKWLNADLTSDLLFGMFCDDLEVSHRLLNVFLRSSNIKTGKIKKVIRQYPIELGYDIHGVRFDVLIEGSDKVFNIEIQTGIKQNLALRMRFYQAMLDIHLLPKGGTDTYTLLPETYIIFICTDQDPFKENQLEYVINPYTQIEKTQQYKKFETKATWIVYNALGYKEYNESIKSYDEELKSFFAFLKKDPIENEFTNYLNKHFTKVKQNIEMERSYMLSNLRDIEKYNEFREEGREEGRAEGRDELRDELIVKMLKLKKNLEEIQEITDCEISKILEIKTIYSL